MSEVLVVDDQEAIRDVLSGMLAVMGHGVVTAGSGEEGLNLFLNNAFQLVLTDLEMPGMDGLTLACRIKESSPNTSVIVITGSERDCCRKAGKRELCRLRCFKAL